MGISAYILYFAGHIDREIWFMHARYIECSTITYINLSIIEEDVKFNKLLASASSLAKTFISFLLLSVTTYRDSVT